MSHATSERVERGRGARPGLGSRGGAPGPWSVSDVRSSGLRRSRQLGTSISSSQRGRQRTEAVKGSFSPLGRSDVRIGGVEMESQGRGRRCRRGGLRRIRRQSSLSPVLVIVFFPKLNGAFSRHAESVCLPSLPIVALPEACRPRLAVDVLATTRLDDAHLPPPRQSRFALISPSRIVGTENIRWLARAKTHSARIARVEGVRPQSSSRNPSARFKCIFGLSLHSVTYPHFCPSRRPLAETLAILPTCRQAWARGTLALLVQWCRASRLRRAGKTARCRSLIPGSSTPMRLSSSTSSVGRGRPP